MSAKKEPGPIPSVIVLVFVVLCIVGMLSAFNHCGDNSPGKKVGLKNRITELERRVGLCCAEDEPLECTDERPEEL